MTSRIIPLATTGQCRPHTATSNTGSNGYIRRDAKAITLGSHLFEQTTPAARIKIVAESVAYIVGQRLGLDTSSYSAGYVASWAGGDSQKLHALAERIDQAARPILAAFD